MDGSVGVVSKASTTPLRNVNQFEAIELCKTLGSNYHLITNAEWMTIARNLEQVSSNWANGVIGSTIASGGGLKRGNVGMVDSASYNAVTDPEDGTGRDTKALLNFSNGEGIWDFSGNVHEWLSDSMDCSAGYPCLNMPYDATPASEIIYLQNLNTYGSLGYDLIMPSNSTWHSLDGIGRIYTGYNFSWMGDSLWNRTHSFYRGGYYLSGSTAGIFSLTLNYGPSWACVDVGFRCSYTR